VRVGCQIAARASPPPGRHAASGILSRVQSADSLRDALAAVLAGEGVRELADAVETLIGRYRTPGAATTPILHRPVDVLAYAAYRMPATHAAVRAALTRAAQAVPGLRPDSLLDLGGGTGAATWAATEVFTSLARVTVLDQVEAALELGRQIARGHPVLASARRERWIWPTPAPTLPTAELVTVSYVLGELPQAQHAALVQAAAGAARTAVAIIEPGTPAGYGRVLTARQALIEAGYRIVAPCPHQLPCPLRGDDWCHFAVRVNRSALHRQVKGAELGYEDEKFSFVVGVRNAATPAELPSRVLRRPVQRKGLVVFRLCTPEGTSDGETVSKRQGERYRAARDVGWGDAWT
jgi:ribosomal protein RSM22 (predicted rRNA methylase)